ncbi:MAG TPA: hypothetical protein DIT64_07995 [Verrucomicrobiales bacterium]|nr:hypothetical protein [Verrucomicrobiales bacterium]
MMRKLLDGLYAGCLALAGLFLVSIFALMIGEAVMRKAGSYITGAGEIIGWCCAAAGFLALPSVFARGEMVRVTYLVDALPPLPRKGLLLGCLLLGGAPRHFLPGGFHLVARAGGGLLILTAQLLGSARGFLLLLLLQLSAAGVFHLPLLLGGPLPRGILELLARGILRGFGACGGVLHLFARVLLLARHFGGAGAGGLRVTGAAVHLGALGRVLGGLGARGVLGFFARLLQLAFHFGGSVLGFGLARAAVHLGALGRVLGGFGARGVIHFFAGFLLLAFHGFGTRLVLRGFAGTAVRLGSLSGRLIGAGAR